MNSTFKVNSEFSKFNQKHDSFCCRTVITRPPYSPGRKCSRCPLYSRCRRGLCSGKNTHIYTACNIVFTVDQHSEMKSTITFIQNKYTTTMKKRSENMCESISDVYFLRRDGERKFWVEMSSVNIIFSGRCKRCHVMQYTCPTG